jgi:hypothetical protein
MSERMLPHVKLIAALQDVHDYADVSDWEGQLRQVAANFNLTYNPPSEAT